jgi:CBS domain-containing protein
MTLEKPLESLTAVDLMSPKLITVQEGASLTAAAKQLASGNIRGAPVVDAEGHCVGVISTTDFMRAAMTADAKDTPPSCGSDFYSPWQLIDPHKLPRQTVGQIMTKNPCTVGPDTPIATLARMMVDSHIHRLIVVEDAGRLLGIVSATDLLDALALIHPSAAFAAAPARW